MAQENSFLPSLWHEEDTVLLCAVLRTSAVGKGSKLEGVQVKSGGWHTWPFKTGWGNWACLGCTGDLIALFHSGDYRGDRARLSLKMPRERTRASSCNFLEGKLWPYSREKGFSQWGESGSDGTFVLQTLETRPWGNDLTEVNLVLNRWGGLLEVSPVRTPQIACVINCSIPLLLLIIFQLKFQVCI